MARIDVNPQLLTLEVTEDAANTYTQSRTATPVVSTLANGKALVMELLKIWFSFSVDAGQDGDAVHIELSSSVSAALQGEGSGELLCRISITNRFTTSGSKTNILYPAMGIIYDMTDGNGNGLLYGNREIFLAVQGVSQGSAEFATCKLLYRLKEVSATELIGILQQ